MQISELVRRSGVTLASVKFYIREGMLAPGEAVNARRAEYGEHHLERLLVIKALTDVAGLPLARTKRILRVLDRPDRSLAELLAEAITAAADDQDDVPRAEQDLAAAYPRASRAIATLGPAFRPRMPALAQLDRALEAAEASGFPTAEEGVGLYGPHVQAIAEAELAGLPTDDAASAVRYAVLGTTLVEPVLAALRRLAHQNLAAARLADDEA